MLNVTVCADAVSVTSVYIPKILKIGNPEIRESPIYLIDAAKPVCDVAVGSKETPQYVSPTTNAPPEEPIVFDALISITSGVTAPPIVPPAYT